MFKRINSAPLLSQKRCGVKIIFLALVFFALPIFVSADALGQTTEFFVDPSYDQAGREKITAVLKTVSQNGYFYLEDEWYKNLTEGEKKEVNQGLEILTQEFDKSIYPKLTAIYGSEWKPGIDKDSRITILFHRIKENAGGYFNPGDGYPKEQVAISNQREMLYLNANYISDDLAKSFLAHEFTHLITFHQKDIKRLVEEEIWLNEARAEYAPTLVGYDKDFEGSNLHRRVKTFLENSSDSSTEWKNLSSDYGVLNLFTQYLVNHYGVEILSESLQTSKVGIPSINYALKKQGYETDFSRVFTDWTVAVLLNDCQFGKTYCYKNKDLKDLKIVPTLIFLPSTQKTEFSLDYATKQWSGNWYRIIGGDGELKIKFKGDEQVKFKVPYVICEDADKCSVDFLDLDEKQKGEISFENFGEKWTSLTLIPSIQSKISGFNGEEPSFAFFLSASIEFKSEEEKLIEQLQSQIAELQSQIAVVQAAIQKILSERISCQKFEKNLYFGMKNDEVRCLQEFLSQQSSDIYPEKLVTSYFGFLTRVAVIRFQEKYAHEILEPFGLTRGTGYFGFSSRNKANIIMFNPTD